MEKVDCDNLIQWLPNEVLEDIQSLVSTTLDSDIIDDNAFYSD